MIEVSTYVNKVIYNRLTEIRDSVHQQLRIMAQNETVNEIDWSTEQFSSYIEEKRKCDDLLKVILNVQLK